MWPVLIIGALAASPRASPVESGARCELLSAVLSATGTVQFGGKATAVRPLAETVPKSARLNGRILVRAVLRSPDGKERPLLEQREVCETSVFVVGRPASERGEAPQNALRVEIVEGPPAGQPQAFRFNAELIAARPSPPGWYAARQQPVYRGIVEGRDGKWTSRIDSVGGK